MNRACSGMLVSIVALLAAHTAAAADWHDGPGARVFAGPARTAALAYLTEFAPQLKLRGVELKVHSDYHALGLSTVRYSQTYNGLPVFDGVVTVRMADDGRVLRAMVEATEGLSVNPKPALDATGAARAAEKFFGKPLSQKYMSRLGVRSDRHGGKLVWQVDSFTPHGMWRYEVDAHTGTVINAYSLAKDALGRVYLINSVQTPSTTDTDLPNLTPTTPVTAQKLAGRAGNIYRHVSGDASNGSSALVLSDTAVAPDTNGDFLFDPDNVAATQSGAWTDSFCETNIYFHIDRVNTFWRDNMGLNGFDDPSWQLEAVGNYGPPAQTAFDNAFYTPFDSPPNAIFIGQGAKTDYGYDSDVFLHEYTHYISHNDIGFDNGYFDQFGFTDMPGAIDEGTADYFSCSINNNAVVGEASLGQYARNLDQMPGTCPGYLVGETHADGILIGSVSWAVRKIVGATISDPLVFHTMKGLDTSPSLGDFGNGIADMTATLATAGTITSDQAQQITDALHVRGLDDCNRELEVTPTNSRKSVLVGMESVAESMGGSCSQLAQMMSVSSIFQFKRVPDPADKRVNFVVDLSGYVSGTLDWDIYVATNTMVTFTSTGENFGVDQFDYSLTGISTKHGELVIDSSSNPPFNPASTYDLVIASRSCSTTTATVSVSANPAPVADAGADGAADGATDSAIPFFDAGKDAALDAAADGGIPAPQAANCGCRAVGNAHGIGWLVAAALASLFAARRRRTGA